MKTTFIAGILSAGMFLFLAAAPQAAEQDTLNAYDVKFVKSAGQSSLNEVKIAELGRQKATNQEVKALAVTLVKDHQNAMKELKGLAEKKGVSLSAAVDPDTAAKFKDLETKTGSAFDTALVMHMDDTHIKSIRSFEQAQEDAKDPDLKAWIDKTVVVIKAHHEAIKKLK